MRIPISLKLYLASARRKKGGAGVSLPPRAPGPYLWLHVSGRAHYPPLPELIEHIQDEYEDLNVLVTVRAEEADLLDKGLAGADLVVLHNDHPEDMRDLVGYWKPDVLVFAGAGLRPGLVVAADAAGVPLIMMDAEAPSFPGIERQWLPGLAKPLLRAFGTILARDAPAARALVRQGAARGVVRIGGMLEQMTPPPRCSEEERDEMAGHLAARPVWMALAVDQDEENLVERAHRALTRISHRLLLILEPADRLRVSQIERAFCKAGWRVVVRSRGELPDGDAQICIADAQDERGLWLRLAPVCFMGGTLCNGGNSSPLEPAALGSAILHGPKTAPFLETYLQLDNAGAARLVLDGSGLVRALEVMLAPDKTAAMANAAWDYYSSASLATGRARDLILETLGKGGRKS